MLTQAGEYYGEQRELDGTIHITRSRYLHLHTDLWLSVFSSDDNIIDPNSRALIDTYADRYPKLTGGLERSGYLPAAEYVLQQSRRMRSGETHYIDHPYFGLIALITPLTTEKKTPSYGSIPHPLSNSCSRILRTAAMPVSRAALIASKSIW